MNKLIFPITEIFSSFQGEGPYQGKGATFIRFAGCNLKCTWCDTKYSWHPDYIEFSQMSIEEIIQEIEKFGNNHIVITGGEPLLYQRAISALREAFSQHFIEVETSGSIALQIGESTVDHFNISPKLSNSKNDNYRLKMKPKNCIFKFVIEKEQDIEEVQSFTEKWEITADKIWIMPQGTDKLTLENRAKWLQPLAYKKNWQFTNRLHILKYGNKKGV